MINIMQILTFLTSQIIDRLSVGRLRSHNLQFSENLYKIKFSNYGMIAVRTQFSQFSSQQDRQT